MKHAIWTICLLAALAPSVARAGSADDAKGASAEGAARYAQGDYKGALAAYQKANYLNLDEPVYYRNIADCYRGLYNTAEAIRFYKLYLREKPSASDKQEIKVIIDLLEHNPPAPPANDANANVPPAANANANANATASPNVNASPAQLTAAPAAAQKRPVYRRWWFWTTLAVVAAAGVGVGLGVGLTLGNKGSSFMSTLPPFGPGT